MMTIDKREREREGGEGKRNTGRKSLEMMTIDREKERERNRHTGRKSLEDEDK